MLLRESAAKTEIRQVLETEREGEGVCVVVLSAPVRGPLECAEAVRAMGTVAAAEEKEVVAAPEGEKAVASEPTDTTTTTATTAEATL